jgi:hypothetical protein
VGPGVDGSFMSEAEATSLGEPGVVSASAA